MTVSDILGIWNLFMTRRFIAGYIPPIVWSYRSCPTAQLTIHRDDFGYLLGAEQAASHYLNQCWSIPRGQCSSACMWHQGRWVNSPALQNQCGVAPGISSSLITEREIHRLWSSGRFTNQPMKWNKSVVAVFRKCPMLIFVKIRYETTIISVTCRRLTFHFENLISL